MRVFTGSLIYLTRETSIIATSIRRLSLESEKTLRLIIILVCLLLPKIPSWVSELGVGSIISILDTDYRDGSNYITALW